MKDEKIIEFSFIQDFPSLQEGIFVLLNISKSQLKKHGLSKKYLNKKIIKGDRIALPINLVNSKLVSPEYHGGEVTEIFEDDNILVLSKPFDLHCHPLNYNEGDNLISYLYSKKRFDLLAVNKDNYDRGLLYRLDYSTSGLVVFLKKDEDYEFARENFSDVVSQKYYLAIVSGKYEGETLLTHLLRSVGEKGKKVVLDEEHTAESKFARCDVELLNYHPEKDMSLLKVRLHQGHRHQVRAQLRIAGYPIVGDQLYHGAKSSRLYLHCYQYGFKVNEKEYSLKDEPLFGLFKLLSLNSKL